MTKPKTPCVVCNAIIYVPVNIDKETAVCTSCKRQGKGPKMERIRICPKCGRTITADNASKGYSRLCADCHSAWHKAREEKKAQREKKHTVISPVVTWSADDDMTFPDTAGFGGFHWLHANTSPVG